MRLSSAYLHCKNAIKEKVPVMLWGPPGIGKSSLVHQIGEDLGFVNKRSGQNNIIDLRLAQLEPTDLRGVPMPNRDTMRADWFLPSFWPERATEDGERTVIDNDGNETLVSYKAGECPSGPGLLFLDEIEKAPVSVKNAALQLILDRRIGSYQLPDDWAMLCAGNREEDGCFSAPLGKALENRMIHFEIDPNVEDWASWARSRSASFPPTPTTPMMCAKSSQWIGWKRPQ